MCFEMDKYVSMHGQMRYLSGSLTTCLGRSCSGAIVSPFLVTFADAASEASDADADAECCVPTGSVMTGADSTGALLLLLDLSDFFVAFFFALSDFVVAFFFALSDFFVAFFFALSGS